jgi:hypothetical protein
VSEGGGDGADQELQHVFIAQDLDQNPEGPKPALPLKASPGSLTPSFKNYAITFSMIVHLRFKS